MDNLIEKAKSQSKKVQPSYNGVQKYLISYIQESKTACWDGSIFRSFIPVKEDRGRMLNKEFTQSFDYLTNSLLDYPTIAASKLGKDVALAWPNYNNLISVQIGRCPLNCWHCFLQECLRLSCHECPNRKSAVLTCDVQRRLKENIKFAAFTAKEILDKFLEQRAYNQSQGVFSNILRITGGEPFLAPDLILDLLRDIKQRNLSNDIILWTETNILPFCVSSHNDTVVSDRQLLELAQYKNLCIHPCFHGLNNEEFSQITGAPLTEVDWEMLLAGFSRLYNAGLDIYPTFGGNVSSECSIIHFFNRLIELDPLLPLRFCVIKYDIDYAPILWRNEHVEYFGKHTNELYSFDSSVKLWNSLLEKQCGYKYAQLPRHMIKRENGVFSSPSSPSSTGRDIIPSFNINFSECIHLFKYPSMPEYQEYVLSILALPLNTKGKVTYGEEWINRSYLDFLKKNAKNHRQAIFWVLNIDPNLSNVDKFKYCIPMRYLEILNVCIEYGQCEITFIAKQFLPHDSQKIVNLNDLEDTIGVDSQSISYIGSYNGFLYIGKNPMFSHLQNVPRLPDWFHVLSDITTKSIVQLTDYPFIHILQIPSAKLKKSGSIKGCYRLVKGRRYETRVFIYQASKYREKYRIVHISENIVKGKLASEHIIISCNESDGDILPIRITAGDINYSIPLYIERVFDWPCFFKDFIPMLAAGVFIVVYRWVTKKFPDPSVFAAIIAFEFLQFVKICEAWIRHLAARIKRY